MRAVLRKIAHGQSLTEEDNQLLEVSPGEVLKDEQKDLNKRRKQLNRMRNLKTRLQENDQNYQSFLDKERAIIKAEKERYMEEQAKIRRQIEGRSLPLVPVGHGFPVERPRVVSS